MINNSCEKEFLPEVTTSNIADITQSSAISGGNVINDGGKEILKRGVCWASSPDPTINDFHTNDGIGAGKFSSILTQLANGTTYYVRAYATNNKGTGYGNSLIFATINPSTESVFKPTGVIPATEEQLLSIPTIESVYDILFSSNDGTKGRPSYYVLNVPSPGSQGSYNSCTSWTVGYGLLGYEYKAIEGHSNYLGLDRNFSPCFIWNQLNAGLNIGTPIALALSLVKSAGCCKVTYMPYIVDIGEHPSEAAKENALQYKISSSYRFESVDIDLMKTILLNDCPIMICLNIDKSFQDGTGLEAQPDGRLVWKKFSNPSIFEFHSVLICGYDDDINAFKVLNSWGWHWGNNGYFYLDYDFLEKAIINFFGPEIYIALVERPRLTTLTVTDIKDYTAQCGGEIITDWGHPITQKGICWSSTNNDPTIWDSDNYTSDGEGSGPFNSILTSLSPNTRYYVKAYAINSEGASYGEPVIFTTKSGSAPVASFTATPTTLIEGESVQFTDQSTNSPTSWSWAFGDGGTSTSKNPSHIFNTVGNYTVSLTVSNNSGSDIETKTNYITVNPSFIADFNASPTTVLLGQSVQFTDQSTKSVTSWIWNFGDYNTSTLQNPSYAYTWSAGTYTISLTASNNTDSDIETKTNYITVNLESLYANIFNSDLDYGSVIDVDGNVYRTVQIGNQIWMAENLGTTKYNDGTPIPLVTNDLEWTDLNTPGYCWYNNDPLRYKAYYGALYNFYVVSPTNSRDVCPTGWHVPSVAEFDTLINYLGGENVAGDMLKEIGATHWFRTPDTGAANNGTNETGFTAIPAGERYGTNGQFAVIGFMAVYYSSTWICPFGAYSYYMTNQEPAFWQINGTPRAGYSVRCIKD